MKENTLIKKSKKLQIFQYFLQITAVIILLNMAFSKLLKAEDSLYIFNHLEMEPQGRFIIALLEIVSSLFLLTKNHAQHGALLAAGIVMGAFIAHFSVLGIEINGDGGRRFYFLIALTVCLSFIIYIKRKNLLLIGKVL